MADFFDILLTVDFDRTLTAPDGSVPQNNLDAIRYFAENGGTFTVNSGRSLPMAAENILNRIPVNAPLLLYNGSAAYDTDKGELVQTFPIGIDPGALVFDLQRRFPELTVEIQGVDAHYAFRENPDWEAYCENNRCVWKYADPRDIPGPFLKAAFYGDLSGQTVASTYDITPAEQVMIDDAIRYAESQYGVLVDVFRACPRIVDIHCKGVSKLRSARQLQKTLSKKYLVCVGDAENDLSMLEGADFAYCPADGMVADRFENVCVCGEGAVADVILRKIPGILGK